MTIKKMNELILRNAPLDRDFQENTAYNKFQKIAMKNNASLYMQIH